MGNVSGVIKAIQDIMRKDPGLSGDAQRIEQLVWMFFLKILDDRELELEFDDDDFVSPIPAALRWRSWARPTAGRTGSILLEFVDKQLFPALKDGLPSQGITGKRAGVIRDVFAEANNFMKNGTLLRQDVNKINEIDFNNTEDRHTFGAIYEKILKDLQSAGNAGEFYTPRAVTKLIVDRLDPKINEIVLDPACGTGGFLACAIDRKRKYQKTTKDRELISKTIRGVEKKALPYNLCITNMILHGIDIPSGIQHRNTLATPLRDYGDKERVHVIATNPPFGGMEVDGIEKNFPALYRTRETADLFMVLIMRLLKKHGRAGVVLPDGFLFGEGKKTEIKRKLLKECNLHTIVRLPKSVFAPYTSIKTNILFFTNGEMTKDIWFYEHKLPENVKAYNKTTPMQFEEFKPLIDWWGDESNGFKSRKESDQAWKVTTDYVEKRGYNLDIPNQNKVEASKRKPEEIFPEFEATQEKIASIHRQIKVVLTEALKR